MMELWSFDLIWPEWKVEDNLDICMSSTKETADKLELADKEAIDAELQVKTSRVK